MAVGRRGNVVLATICALALPCGACRPIPAPADELMEHVSVGECSATVVVSPCSCLVGDRIRVALTVRTPEGFRADLPEPNELAIETVEPFGEDVGIPTETGLVWRRSYVAEPLLAGEFEIPSLLVSCRQRHDDTGASAIELNTPAMNVRVESVLVADEQAFTPRGIYGPLPAPKATWPRVLALAGALVIAAAALWLAVRVFRGRCATGDGLSPRAWAMAALDALAQPAWQQSERQREYHYRLTEVLREFVERQFGLRASKMTTREFLRAVASGAAPQGFPEDTFGEVLHTSDAVKYAGAACSPEDAANVLTQARGIVQRCAALAIDTTERGSAAQ